MGQILGKKVALQISAEGKNLVKEVPLVQIRNCRIDDIGSGLKLDCPIKAQVQSLPKKYERLQAPTHVGVKISGEIQGVSFPFQLSNRIEGNLKAEIDPISTPLVKVSGYWQTQLSGLASEFSKGKGFENDFQIQLNIPEFQKVAEELSRSRFAVPAPFSVLDGKASILASGKVDFESGRIPVFVKTRLSSKKQRFNMDTTGEVLISQISPEFRAKSEFDVVLNDVQLELPKLQLETPPVLFPDSRIASALFDEGKKETPEEEKPFRFKINIRTPEKYPIRVLSNLARAPVPVGMNLTISDSEPVTGTISVERVPLDLYRRDAVLQNLKVDLAKPVEESKMSGSVRVKYVDYTMYLMISGSTESPEIRLTSDPPLPEDQLVAALIFGRPLEELDADQSASVGNTRAAIADGAIGLASLYALASTPIQSIGYDPKTGTFIAKVRLAEGTSLDVGTKSGQISEVGIRKRLGSHWAITTDLNRATTEKDSNASAFLEWTNRY